MVWDSKATLMKGIGNLGCTPKKNPNHQQSQTNKPNNFLWCKCKVHVPPIVVEMSSVENPGWLFDIGDYTTQLYGDYNKPL